MGTCRTRRSDEDSAKKAGGSANGWGPSIRAKERELVAPQDLGGETGRDSTYRLKRMIPRPHSQYVGGLHGLSGAFAFDGQDMRGLLITKTCRGVGLIERASLPYPLTHSPKRPTERLLILQLSYIWPPHTALLLITSLAVCVVHKDSTPSLKRQLGVSSTTSLTMKVRSCMGLSRPHWS